MDDETRKELEQLQARNAELTKAFLALERSYDAIVEALCSFLVLGQEAVKGHSKRVTAFTIAIARKMGISEDEVRVIARGAWLHDIGKMGMPPAILRKRSLLLADEEKALREHCRRGYEMVRKIPFLAEAAEIVYAHHENFDGSGYPRGLKGEQIPLGARLVAVANTLDLLTSVAWHAPELWRRAIRDSP